MACQSKMETAKYRKTAKYGGLEEGIGNLGKFCSPCEATQLGYFAAPTAFVAMGECLGRKTRWVSRVRRLVGNAILLIKTNRIK